MRTSEYTPMMRKILSEIWGHLLYKPYNPYKAYKTCKTLQTLQTLQLLQTLQTLPTMVRGMITKLPTFQLQMILGFQLQTYDITELSGFATRLHIF